MSDYKLRPFPSSAESWLIPLPESVLTVVIWGDAFYYADEFESQIVLSQI